MRLPRHINLRYIRDVIVISMGSMCVGSQIIAQKQGVGVSTELLTAGVTMLTVTPFFWKGDERTDENRGRHEAERS